MNCMGSIGRLGNQMFQYAALRSLAKNFDYNYCLPVIESKMYNEDLNLYDCFLLNEEKQIKTDLYQLNIDTFGFDEAIYSKCPDNVDLHGYFQDVKYFESNSGDIRNSFTFKEVHSEAAKNFFFPAFGSEKVLSLHVRRGDYLNFEHHPTQPLEYYSKALRFFPRDVKVLVFSDDMEWVEQQELFQGERFFLSRNNNTAVDLCMQTFCKYHIITNSTYSWWGAWLANSEKVVKPKMWFGPPIDHYKDFLNVPGWISI